MQKFRDSRSKGLELKIYYNPLCEIGPKANRINGVLVVRGGGGGASSTRVILLPLSLSEGELVSGKKLIRAPKKSRLVVRDK